MSVKVNYKGAEILSVNTDITKTLKTSGKYCEGDIEIVNTQDGGITPSGNINITDTNVTDVTNYATAQVVDADLVASNIKKDVNILGVVGSFEGGGNVLIEHGTIAYHTGELVRKPSIPVSNTSYDNYSVYMKAKNLWTKVDGNWIEHTGVDFTGLTPDGSPILMLWFKNPNSISVINLNGDTKTGTLNGYHIYYRYTDGAIAAGNGDYTFTIDTVNSEISIQTTGYTRACGANFGMTYDYMIVGWNDA